MDFIQSLAIAPLLQAEYNEFRDFLMRAIEVEGDIDGIDAIKIAASSNMVTIDGSGIAFIQNGQRFGFREIADYIQLLRSLYPYVYDCDGKLTYPQIATGGSGAAIDDNAIALTTTWSSTKINTSLGTKQPIGNYILEGDARLTNARTPTGPGGGDFSGSTYPNLVLPATGVTAGAYNAPNLTVDAKGRISAIASNNAYFGATAPTSPSDGWMWFEPGAALPQPWVWDSTSSTGLWMCQPFIYDYGSSTATLTSGSTVGLNRTVPYYGTSSSRLKLIAIRGEFCNDSAVVGTTSVAHTSTDYLGCKLRKFRGSDTAPVDFYTFTSNTASLGVNGGSGSSAAAYKRFTETPNLWMEGNIFLINWYFYRIGSNGTTYSAQCNMQLWLQAARGA